MNKVFISKPKLRAVLILILACSLTGTSVWYLTHAVPSPTIGRIITPGNIGPCTWFASLDGTTPIAQAMVGGLSVGVGDNVVGTAGQDWSTFYTAFASANQNICLSGQTFTIQTQLLVKTGDVIVGQGIDNTIIITSGVFSGATTQQGTILLNGVSNVRLSGFTLTLGSQDGMSGITIYRISNYNTIQGIKVTGTATGLAQVTLWQNVGETLFQTLILNNIFAATTMYGVDFEIQNQIALINDTLIQGNRFENSNPYGVKFSPSFGQVSDTKIVDNTCFNLKELGGTSQQATCVSTAGAQPYTVQHTSIINNYYFNSRNNPLQGVIGVNIKSENDTEIIGNRFVNRDPGGVGTGSIGIAVGAVGQPNIRLHIIDNYFEGWGSFWDPDSMEIVVVQGNVVINCLQQNGGLAIGYNIQMHEIISNNIFVNCANTATNLRGAIQIDAVGAGGGGMGPPATDILVQGNLIVDNRTTPAITSLISTSGAGAANSSDVTIKDNKVWVPKATVSFIVEQNVANIPPRLVQGNTILNNGVQLLPMKITNPFGTVGSITNSVGPYGTGIAVASTTYTVYGTPILLSAGGGASLSITVTDIAGNNLFTAAQATVQALALYPGYKINFGAFTGGPTFIVEIPY